MNPTIQWLTAAYDAALAFVPNLLAGMTIVLLGWMTASILGRLSAVVSHRFGFDRACGKLALYKEMEPRGASKKLGGFVYAIVMLVALVQAARAWGLAFVASGLGAVLAYLPHAIGALLVFAVALGVGNWARASLYRTSEQGTDEEQAAARISGRSRMLPELVRGGILAVGAVISLRELQIAPEIVNAAFMLTLGAVSVAAALAFGLGAREVAGQIVAAWWARREQAEARFHTSLPVEPKRPPVSA